MVTITNGVKTFRVTAGAVEVYKGMGFWVEGSSEPVKVADPGDKGEPIPDAGDESGDDAFIDEIVEKPLSQWTNEEMKEFVRIKGIDTSGAQKVSQVRGIIKNYFENQSKNA